MAAPPTATLSTTTVEHLGEQGRRAALRASSRYLLRAILAGADATGGDITTAMIAVAVMDGDIGYLDAIPELGRRYATYSQPPQDGLRRPTSARAIAARLGLPYETVRRRLEALITSGRCVRTGRGVYSPGLLRADHHEGAQANYAAVRTLLVDLQRGVPDAAWSRAAFSQVASEAEAPLRLVNRRTARFAVDLLSEIAKLTGGYDEALVYIALTESTGRNGAAESPPVIRLSSLARSIRQPVESVRRRLVLLTEQGLITHLPGGYSAQHDPRMEALVARIAEANLTHLRQLFSSLQRLGVTLAP